MQICQFSREMWEEMKKAAAFFWDILMEPFLA